MSGRGHSKTPSPPDPEAAREPGHHAHDEVLDVDGRLAQLSRGRYCEREVWLVQQSYNAISTHDRRQERMTVRRNSAELVG